MGEKDTKRTRPAPLRLGGIGTGALFLQHDGVFLEDAVPGAGGKIQNAVVNGDAFLAIRVSVGDQSYVRKLTTRPSTSATIHSLRPEYLQCRRLYPMEHFRLKDPKCPLDLVWSCFSPFVPYDYDASTLPVVMNGIRISNATEDVFEVSLLFNWGASHQFDEDCITMRPMVLATKMDEETVSDSFPLIRDEWTLDDRDIAPEVEAPKPRFNGIGYGIVDPEQQEIVMRYCLAVQQHFGIDISVALWDPRFEDDVQEFWRRFKKEGDLTRFLSSAEQSTAGAVCCKFRLAPEQEKRLDFVLSWFHPNGPVAALAEGQHPGYVSSYSDAIEPARIGLDRFQYHVGAVEAWQNRIQGSSLPVWLNRMLIESLELLTLNARYTDDGMFRVRKSGPEDVLGDLYNRFLYSMGPLLFFPRFEERELQQYKQEGDREPEGKLCWCLGNAASPIPEFPATWQYQPVFAAQLVLNTYRDFVTTGNHARVRQNYALAEKIMAQVCKQFFITLAEEGRSPEDRIVQDSDAFSSGLWPAALCAFADLSRRLRRKAAFISYQRFYHQALTCLSGKISAESYGDIEVLSDSLDQLYGQWCLDSVGLPRFFDFASVTTMVHDWSGFAPQLLMENLCKDGDEDISVFVRRLIQLVTLEIMHGETEAGLNLLHCWYTGRMGAVPKRYAYRSLLEEEHSSALLGIWHVLNTIEGFVLDVPRQRMVVVPRLTKGSHSISVPIVSPLCFGWLKYQEDRGEAFRLRLRLSFDSPVAVDQLELEVPTHVEDVTISAVDLNQEIRCTPILKDGAESKRLLVIPEDTMIFHKSVIITVEEMKRPVSDDV